MWDKELKGKKVFYADYIEDLEDYVENNNLYFYGRCNGQGYRGYQFLVNGVLRQFVYYDPYYTLKLLHEQGKVIQHFKTCVKVGVDVTSELGWTDNPENYRIKPEEKPVTNHELAQWLAEGYGQYVNTQIGKAKYHFKYAASEDDMPLHKDIRVRVFGDTEWHEPTREYMGLD